MDGEIILQNVTEDSKINLKELNVKTLTRQEEDALKLLNEDPLEYNKQLFARMKEKNPNATCISCGGKPFGKKVCEVCGAGKIVTNPNAILNVSAEEKDRLFIPINHRESLYIPEKLIQSKPTITDINSLKKYSEELNKHIVNLSAGTLPKNSVFISAPSGCAKETFAYSMLQIAMSKGMTVFPYLDLLEVSRLIDAYEKGNTKDSIVDDIKFNDVELYNAKVCILKAPHTNTNMYSFKVMLQVIDRRARRGLSTIILSRYNLNQFTAFDFNKEVQGIVSYNSPTPKNLTVYEYKEK